MSAIICPSRSCFVVFATFAGVVSPCLFAATDVVCSPFIPHTRAVGNTASDIHCTDDTIQAAIDNTVCPNTTIFLTAEHTYSAQHLNIQNKSLSIVGTGATSCSGVGSTGVDASAATTPTAPITTIGGAGNGGNSVVTVGGASNVTLQFVEITGGSVNSDGHGGGVNFNGSGSLTIDTTTIDLNSAGFGGGIEMNGNGGAATLTLKAYSIIESNTAAGNGGGINIEGNAQLIAIQPFTLIGFNHAPNGRGGGIAMVSPARADIGSPGYNALPVLTINDAALGGAISAQAAGDSTSNVNVNLFTTDPRNPITLSGNFASQAGGAIYLKPDASAGFVTVCAADFRIDGNTAPEGSAIFADADIQLLGSAGVTDVHLNPPFNACFSSFVSQPCALGIACNTVDGNTNADAGNHPKPGAVIATSASSLSAGIHGNRFAMRENVGAHAIRAVDSDLHVDNCLIADNAFSAETLSAIDGGNADSTFPPLFVADACTIANNAHNSGSVIHTDLDLTLTNTIIDQPVMSTLNTGHSPTVIAHFVLAADPTGLAAAPDIFPGEPTFVDAASGNYHLRADVQGGSVTSSLGIDIAPPNPGTAPPDLDGNPRYQDVPLVPNFQGIGDIGCYEAQPIVDRIFGDAFGDPLSLVR